MESQNQQSQQDLQEQLRLMQKQIESLQQTVEEKDQRCKELEEQQERKHQLTKMNSETETTHSVNSDPNLNESMEKLSLEPLIQQQNQQTVKSYILPNRNMFLRSTKAVIDLEKIRYNVKQMKKYIQEKFNPNATMMAIVKSNSYGHGAVNIVPEMIKAGCDWFGVALLEEAIELRDAGIEAPILLLGTWEPEGVSAFFDYMITPVVYSQESYNLLNEEAKKRNTTINAHIKVDSGMGRVGFTQQQFDELLNEQTFNIEGQNVFIEGFMTHMSSADMSTELEFTKQQNLTFQKMHNQFLEFIKLHGDKEKYQENYKPIVHFSNSSTSTKTEKMPFIGDMYRVGDVLYGGKRGEYDGVNWFWDFKPALEYSTVITSLKSFPKGSSVGYCRAFKTEKEETKIAVMPIGYGDGLFTQLGRGRGKVQVVSNGIEYECPIVGNVCMDMTLVEVTDVPDVKVGNKIILIGGKQTQEVISEMAGVACSSVITCQIGLRVPRVYINQSE